MKDQGSKGMHEVPRQIFDSFLEELEKLGVSEQEVAKRLRDVLLGSGTITHDGILQALFPKE